MADIYIEPLKSAWNSPYVLIIKLDDSLRLCINYKAKTDKYPLAGIDESIYGLYVSKFYSKMDMAKGYYQMQITAESREKLLLAPLRVSFSLIKT